MKYIGVVLLVLGLTACSKTTLLPEGNTEISLSRAYSNGASDGAVDDKITSLRYYIVDDGVVKTIHSDILADASYINLPKGEITPTSEIYIIANGELCPELSQIKVGAAQSKFDEFRTSQSGSNGQMPMLVMSCRAALKSYVDGGTIPLTLSRNVARFDLIVQPNVNIAVVSVRVDGLSTSSSVFEATTPKTVANTSTYVGDFSASPKTASVPRLFYAHERAVGGTAAVATIDVKYNGKLTTITAPVSAIKRNCIHKIMVSANGGMVTAGVELSDMETGDQDESQTEDQIITIDNEATVLGKGAMIDFDNKRVILPATGATVSLVLKGPKGIHLMPIDNKVDDFSITKVMDGEIEKSYTITTSANKRMSADNKAIILNFTYDGDRNNNTHRIVVAITNYAQFEYVTIGNLEWMTYNSISKNPADYPQRLDGETVKFILAEQWAKYTGRAHQWGPRPGVKGTGVQYMLAAWEETAYYYTALRDCNGGIIGGNKTTRWTGSTVPCPDGWRLPTYAEFQTIWPTDGTTLVDNMDTPYTTSAGNSYEGRIETFGGGFSVPGDNWCSSRNIIITGNNDMTLIFPIAGYRAKHSAQANPNGGLDYSKMGRRIGTEVYYWCADKTGGNFVAVGILKGVIKNSTANRDGESWLNSRCVRDVPTI